MFEEMKEAFGYNDIDDLVYALCENEVNFGSGYVFENKYPEYSLRSEDLDLYNSLYELRIKENNEKYYPYIQSKKDEWGYEHLQQEGGGEGGSEYCYGVFRLGDKIYKAEYSYYSYNGHEYDGIYHTLKEVKPVQKTITVYV